VSFGTAKPDPHAEQIGEADRLEARGRGISTRKLTGVQLWCQDNLRGDLSIAAMAERAGMSERSFSRAFRKDAGQTPAEFVLNARLQAVCRMLSETALPLKAIATDCGFKSPQVMRRAFARRYGVSVADYRDKFSVV
jgi:transcriptional regulator GlxA family with amidase domain